MRPQVLPTVGAARHERLRSAGTAPSDRIGARLWTPAPSSIALHLARPRSLLGATARFVASWAALRGGHGKDWRAPMVLPLAQPPWPLVRFDTAPPEHDPQRNGLAGGHGPAVDVCVVGVD